MGEFLLNLYVDYGVQAMLFVFAAMSWVAGRFVQNNATVSRAIGELRDAVQEVNQTYVDGLKRGREPASDGGSRLTDAEKAAAKAEAIAIAKANIGAKGLKRLGRVLGVDLDGWFNTKTESIVAGIKAARAGGAPPPATPR